MWLKITRSVLLYAEMPCHLLLRFTKFDLQRSVLALGSTR